MYIKIKNIKKFILILVCVILARFNYFTYVKADDLTKNSEQTSCNKTIDSDCDSLTNDEEKLYGTDASNSDSDGDGYSDGVEVKSGFDPSKPAPGDRVSGANSLATSSDQDQDASQSLTLNFSRDLQSFINSKGNQPITNTDINNFVTQSLADKTGTPITIDSLPELDTSKLEILKQDYSSLNETDRKEKIKQDAIQYLMSISYLLISNAPQTILTVGDFQSFRDTFMDRLSTIAGTNPDYQYFNDLGNHLDLFISEAYSIKVPETMVELHVKFFRIAKAFLALKEDPALSNINDPLTKMILVKKIDALINMTTNLISVELTNYFANLNNKTSQNNE